MVPGVKPVGPRASAMPTLREITRKPHWELILIVSHNSIICCQCTLSWLSRGGQLRKLAPTQVARVVYRELPGARPCLRTLSCESLGTCPATFTCNPSTRQSPKRFTLQYLWQWTNQSQPSFSNAATNAQCIRPQSCSTALDNF